MSKEWEVTISLTNDDFPFELTRTEINAVDEVATWVETSMINSVHALRSRIKAGVFKGIDELDKWKK